MKGHSPPDLLISALKIGTPSKGGSVLFFWLGEEKGKALGRTQHPCSQSALAGKKKKKDTHSVWTAAWWWWSLPSLEDAGQNPNDPSTWKPLSSSGPGECC